MFEMLKIDMIFGKLCAWLYSIEWQKCGLLHAHNLDWLIPEHKITPDKIDDTVSGPAEVVRLLRFWPNQFLRTE